MSAFSMGRIVEIALVSRPVLALYHGTFAYDGGPIFEHVWARIVEGPDRAPDLRRFLVP